MLKFFILPYVFVELICAYFFINSYGFLNLVFETIFTGVIGLFLMSKVGFLGLFSRLMFLSGRDIFAELGIGIGGFLLFIPGIFSDILGAVIAILTILRSKKTNEPVFYETKNENKGYKSGNYGEVIDVEIVEERR